MYVSCDPTALYRDATTGGAGAAAARGRRLRRRRRAGRPAATPELARVAVLDPSPSTAHVECGSLWIRKGTGTGGGVK